MRKQKKNTQKIKLDYIISMASQKLTVWNVCNYVLKKTKLSKKSDKTVVKLSPIILGKAS